MKIQKVINNNIVSCIDHNGNEIIVMGKGLGFNAKAEGVVDTKRVEKTFYMSSEADTQSLATLLGRLPQEYIDISYRIIDYASKVLDRELRENIYLTLTDHLGFAIEQIKAGQSFNNVLLQEVKIFYKQEFAVGKYALNLINEELGLAFPDDEAASIALHLINAEYYSSVGETVRIASSLHEIMAIINSQNDIHLDTEALCYDELKLAIKMMVMRNFSANYTNKFSSGLFREIQNSYYKEFRLAKKITDYITAQTSNPVSDEDVSFLALLLYRAGKPSGRVSR